MEFNITDLLCGRVVNGNKCNELGNTIARNLIRIAGTQIFDDPNRAFIELIVNSIDAVRKKYGINNPVGKFGFRFLSILYYTKDNGYIIVRSNNWQATITDDLKVKFEYTDYIEGTSITVHNNEIIMVQYMIIELIENTLFDVPIRIIHNDYDKQHNHLVNIFPPSHLPVIIITINEGEINISDKGSGITEDIYF